MFYVYILQDKVTNKNYVGFTEDLKSRIKSHNTKTVKTTSQGNYELIFYCAFKEKFKALEFERYLKHGSGHSFAKKHLV